jgi:nitroimidazol reductase NimA-like FMN-containing flavoprotein (pyridoxamine 5'-phosphate oxidase superfamily)
MTFGWANGSVYIYGRGQKTVNIRRNPNATILVDVGSAWRELKGIMMRGQAKILESETEEAADPCLRDAQMNLGKKSGLMKDGEVQPYAASASGNTRRWIVFEPTSVVSWDNGKLG